MITWEELRKQLEYNSETGLWRWKPGFTGNGRKQGWFPGTLDNNGYRKVRIGGSPYYAHRLAWFYIWAAWPEVIDHVDGVRSNNKIDNLRNPGYSMNAFSKKLSTDSRGIVYLNDLSNKNKPWRASIMHKGDTRYAFFSSKEEAIDWRKEMEIKLFGEHPP